MAEVLLRVVDKGAAEEASRAGDVIVVCADGWGWTLLERTNPAWVVVKLPGTDPSVLVDMTVGDFDGDGRLLRRRARKIDLGAPAVAAVLTGLGSDRVVTLSTPQATLFLAARTTKPSIGGVVRLG